MLITELAPSMAKTGDWMESTAAGAEVPAAGGRLSPHPLGGSPTYVPFEPTRPPNGRLAGRWARPKYATPRALAQDCVSGSGLAAP